MNKLEVSESLKNNKLLFFSTKNTVSQNEAHPGIFWWDVMNSQQHHKTKPAGKYMAKKKLEDELYVMIFHEFFPAGSIAAGKSRYLWGWEFQWDFFRPNFPNFWADYLWLSFQVCITMRITGALCSPVI